MDRSIVAMMAAVLLAVPASNAIAQTTPARVFANHSEIYSASLSPLGDYVALAVPNAAGTESRVQVVKLDGSGKTQELRFGSGQHVSDILWSDDGQIVVSRAEMQPLQAAPVSYGELMSSNIDGSDQEVLFAYVADQGTKRGRRKDEGFATVSKVLPQEPGSVLVEFTCWKSKCGEESPTTIYKVDTRTGHRDEIERSGKPANFDFDQSARARIMTTWDINDDPVLHYRKDSGSEWQPMPKSLAGYTVGATWFASDNNSVLAVISDHGEPSQLYRLDMVAGTREKLIGRDDVGITSLMYEGYDGPPFAVVYDADKPSIQYLDPKSEWAQLHLALLKQFPGEMVSIIDASRDGQKVLFSVWSDRHPGGYYVFDRNAKHIQLIVERKPAIDPELMAKTKPIAFKSRDGRQLYGFVTSKGTGPQPMVVMPHGGPYGPYDTWGYNDDAQFLASRGYAVLQVNFRGSGGRGEDFMTAGYREWGGKIQDDITDGVQWAIDNKLADPRRICTFGGSFGGYAALMNPIRNPGMYQCAIGYVGVYDLGLMFKAGDIKQERSGRRYLSRVLGDDPVVLAANSPAQQVDKIKVPVLLIAGKDDRRVPMDQFNVQASAFRAAGVAVETMVVDGEGHGFYAPEHIEQMYNKVADFLDRQIGAKATIAGGSP